ncbi:MAG: CxC ATPase DNA modification system associated small protein [Geitlerinemataceae cyanobacterium]
MALDDKVTDAIRESVLENGQSEQLAKKLVQWLNDLADGNTSLDRQDDLETYLENSLNAIQVYNKLEE